MRKICSDNRDHYILLRTAQEAGINTVGPSLIDGAGDSDYLRFFAETSEDGAEGLFVDGSPENITKRQLIVELAAKYQLPAIYAFRSFVEAGGLMAYGTELREVFRQAARTIDKILRGAKPGDIPYYQPTVFELIINLGQPRHWVSQCRRQCSAWPTNLSSEAAAPLMAAFVGSAAIVLGSNRRHSRHA